MKRCKISLILFILLCLATLLLSCSPKEPEAPEPAPTEEKKTLMLFLGDSIGEALAGPTPLTEREAYGYYGIIGNTNGYEYYNRAVTGYTTQDLRNIVRREDDGVNRVRSLIETADVIHISSSGNDFLNSSHSQMMIDIANDVDDRITPRQITAKANFEATFATLRELNPNALIFVQTLYNPAGTDSPLIPSYARSVLASKGIGPEGYHALMNKLMAKINATIYEYLDEHTVTDENGIEKAPFEVIDVYSAFEKIYEEDPVRWERLICEDGVHPHTEGHAIIAGLIQDKLVEHGLAAPNALHNYKRDKARQLERLYADLSNKESVRAEIMRATCFADVTKAYFDGTEGVVPHYTELPRREGRTFEETKTFKVSYFSVFGSQYTGAIELNDSEITFTADGEYVLYAPLRKLMTATLKYKIDEEGGINANDEFSFDLATYYFSDFAPGVNKRDLEGVLKAITYYHGIEIIGLDYENPYLQAILERYRQTGELVIDTSKAIGDLVAIKCTGHYTLDTVTTTDGKEYTAIYVNNEVGRGESFVRYTLTKDASGAEKVRMTIDVARLELEGVAEAE